MNECLVGILCIRSALFRGTVYMCTCLQTVYMSCGYRRRRNKRPGRLLGSLLDGEGGGHLLRPFFAGSVCEGSTAQPPTALVPEGLCRLSEVFTPVVGRLSEVFTPVVGRLSEVFTPTTVHCPIASHSLDYPGWLSYLLSYK